MTTAFRMVLCKVHESMHSREKAIRLTSYACGSHSSCLLQQRWPLVLKVGTNQYMLHCKPPAVLNGEKLARTDRLFFPCSCVLLGLCLASRCCLLVGYLAGCLNCTILHILDIRLYSLPANSDGQLNTPPKAQHSKEIKMPIYFCQL